MSIGDWIMNQQDENSNRGIVQDLDKWDDHRIQLAMKHTCPLCYAASGVRCFALNSYEVSLNGDWAHCKRESKKDYGKI